MDSIKSGLANYILQKYKRNIIYFSQYNKRKLFFKSSFDRYGIYRTFQNFTLISV